jgi:hypothetical protein
VVLQAPLVHAPELHTLPQVPQLLGSVRALVVLQGAVVEADGGGGTVTVTVYFSQLLSVYGLGAGTHPSWKGGVSLGNPDTGASTRISSCT